MLNFYSPLLLDLIPKWSVEGNRMKGTSGESKSTNSYLDALKAKVYDYQQQLIREDEPVNAKNMRNKILGVEKRSHMIVGIFQQHNDEIKVLIGKEYAAATLVRYETSIKHTVDFIKWEYKVSDINIRKIDHEFITSYEFYLKRSCNYCQNTTSKYIKNFGKISRICLVMDEFKNKDGFSLKIIKHFSILKKNVEMIEFEFIK